MKHFLCLQDFEKSQILEIINLSIKIKRERSMGQNKPYLGGKILGMIFEKSSTRTRVSFEAGIYQLGGMGIFLSNKDIQLGRGEPISDTAKVISSMCDMVMMRTFEHSRIVEFAAHSSVPVINGLTDDFHPVQLMADLLTMIECGIFEPKDLSALSELDSENLNSQNAQGFKTPVVAYIGDGNNVAHSWLNLCAKLGFELRIASPKGYEPDSEVVKFAQNCAKTSGAKIILGDDVNEAIKGANVVTTDTWASMGQEDEKESRKKAFSGYFVDEQKMSLAQEGAIFLHCLPAYRGQEVSAGVIDGAQSRVFLEAQNRLHAQKGIMVWLARENSKGAK